MLLMDQMEDGENASGGQLKRSLLDAGKLNDKVDQDCVLIKHARCKSVLRRWYLEASVQRLRNRKT